MLFTIGLGQGAIPMAAAIQWVLKDGIGNAAAIAYAAAVNTKFDEDAKRYRFQSTVALTASDFMAIAMPLCPQHFLLIASLSSGIGSIASLAQTASRARVMTAFAVHGNLADCTRAGQTQGKLMSILGTSAGAGLSWFIGSDPLRVALCILPLAAASLYSMHVSSQLVVLRSPNVQRAERVFHSVLLQLPLDLRAASAESPVRVPTPEQVAQVETFVVDYSSVFGTELLLQPLIGGPPTGGWRLALPFTRHVPKAAVAEMLGFGDPAAPDASGEGEGGAWSASWHEGGKYALALRHEPARDRWQVVAWHNARSASIDKLQAVWHACVLRHALDRRCEYGLDLDAAHAAARALWPAVHRSLEEADWHLVTVYLDGEGACLENEPRPRAQSDEQPRASLSSAARAGDEAGARAPTP
ncbi:vitamin B6 photo-protection and homoeostasis-domain-containing protein [Pavlovales sp. CCMP2436]|nr:vitamin B6 photo-protection and homoeostasis-domain-containing protein [Pavlovales sp. CCMP2436]